MPDSYQALSVSIEENLLPFSALLHQQGVLHRIFEEGGRQIVIVGQQGQTQQVEALYAAWRSGKVGVQVSPQQPTAESAPLSEEWRQVPVILGLIGLSICGFLLIFLSAPMSWISYLTFTPFRISGDQLFFQTIDGQYWRLITPVFLHFGWLHITFNCLWLWELGKRVEQVVGHLNMLMIFLVIAAVSNFAQFAYDGDGIFGGMSGVVYGLLGFSWVAPMLQPTWEIQPRRSLLILMLGWLVACMVGLVEVLGFGAIANAAHLGGLLCGALLGALIGGLSRAGRDSHHA
jgi:GlpG protein